MQRETCDGGTVITFISGVSLHPSLFAYTSALPIFHVWSCVHLRHQQNLLGIQVNQSYLFHRLILLNLQCRVNERLIIGHVWCHRGLHTAVITFAIEFRMKQIDGCR
jgi:hypothetical protein